MVFLIRCVVLQSLFHPISQKEMRGLLKRIWYISSILPKALEQNLKRNLSYVSL